LENGLDGRKWMDSLTHFWVGGPRNFRVRKLEGDKAAGVRRRRNRNMEGGVFADIVLRNPYRGGEKRRESSGKSVTTYSKGRDCVDLHFREECKGKSLGKRARGESK